jgi:two-component system NarL family sensor kinase
MRERLDALGGKLSLSSQAGHTIVTARVPMVASALQSRALQETSL